MPTTPGIRAGLLLVIVSLIVLLPGIRTASLFERDEAAYAQMSREILESGQWIVPPYLGEPWMGKPPLALWLTAISFRVFGVGEWQARAVSVAATVACVLLVARWAAGLYGRRAGLVAGLMFITGGLVACTGRLLLTDSLLLLFLLMAVLAHWRMASEAVTHARAAAYWLAIGLGILVKGPAILLFAGLFAIALLSAPGCRAWIARWRWWAWTPLGIASAGWWYVCASRAVGPQLHEQLLWHEVIERMLRAEQGHSGPPGYYVLAMLAGLLPWTPFAPGAIVWAWQRRRQDPAARVLLLWPLLSWLALELISTKLPHYALPCCVPISILLAAAAADALRRGTAVQPAGGERAVLRLWAAIPIALGLALCAVAAYGHAAQWSAPTLAAGLGLAGGFATVGFLVRRGKAPGAFAAAVAVMCVFYGIAGSFVLPATEPYRLSRLVADRVNAMATPSMDVIACQYEEPTVFFYMRMPGRVLPVSKLAEAFHSARRPTLILSRDRDWQKVGIVPGAPGARWESVTGINLGRSRRETVWLAVLAVNGS